MFENLFSRMYFLMRLAMLHLVLSASGLFVFGFSPANATILYLYKQYRTNIESYNFSEAWSYFKSQFLRANLFFAISVLLTAFFLYTVWLYATLSTNWLFLIGLLLQASFVVVAVGVYGVYLQLQCYYELSLLLLLKLSMIGLFLDLRSLLKWFIGTGLCLFFATKVPLLLAVFLPTIWLLFSSDVLEPISQKIESRMSI